MLNFRLCFVDPSEKAYSLKSLYTQTLGRAQLDLLYLVSALSQRPHRVTVVGPHETAFIEQGIRFLPWPDDPVEFWQAESFDAVICLNSLQGLQELKPYLASETPFLLWSHLVPEHVAMLPLQHESIHTQFQAFVFDNILMRNTYASYFQLPPEKTHYRYPTMVRTLRKRFLTSQMLIESRSPSLSIAFTAHPSQGLAQILEMYQLLLQGFTDLQLRVLLPSDFDRETEPIGIQALLDRCHQTEGVELIQPLPWTNWADELIKCHVWCHPLVFADPTGMSLVDPLAAGCEIVAAEHPALREVGREHLHWISPQPEQDYLQRYSQAVSRILRQLLETPEERIESQFRQASFANTLFTWDLRVWEWESLLYAVIQPDGAEGAESTPAR